MRFYKDSTNGLFYIGDTILPAGKYTMNVYEPSTISIKSTDTSKVALSPIDVSDLSKENGDFYTSIIELLAANKDFFMSGSGGGGTPGPGDGDMLKSTYDINNSGRVDTSDALIVNAADSTIHVTEDQSDALDGANSPGAGNAFATMSDVPSTAAFFPIDATEIMTGTLRIQTPGAASRIILLDENGIERGFYYHNRSTGQLSIERKNALGVIESKLLFGSRAVSMAGPAGGDPEILNDNDLATKKYIDIHILDMTNPHAVTKAQVGLANVDNTSDIDKPVSDATQDAIDAMVLSAITGHDEGGGIGYYPEGMDRTDYGSIGFGALDLSEGDDKMIDKGAKGIHSFVMGYNTKSSGYAALVNGWDNEANANYSIVNGISNVTGGGGIIMNGVALNGGGQELVMILGSCNTIPPNNIYSLQVGNGTYSVYGGGSYDDLQPGDRAYQRDVPSDSFRVYKTGLVEAPSLDVSEIDAGGNKVLITKEYGDDRYLTGGTWGAITGTLSNQIDLQTELDNKVSSVTSGTNVVINNTDPQNPVISVIPTTSAGILSRVHFTGDEVTTGIGTFYKTNTEDKGIADSQQVSLDKDETKWYLQDFLGAPTVEFGTLAKGNYTGAMTVRINDNNGDQEFTIEAYLADIDGNVIDSGIAGEPIGDLGVTPIIVMDTGVLDIVRNNNSIIVVTGIMKEDVSYMVNLRIRYHISATKVGGTVGTIMNTTIYFGGTNIFYVDSVVAVTTNTVENKSVIPGAMTTDALNDLDSRLPANTVNWAGLWTAGSYKKNDMVRDEGWLSIANVDTSERPIPIHTDILEYVINDDGSTYQTVTETLNEIKVGNELEIIQGGWMHGARVWLFNDVSIEQTIVMGVYNSTGDFDELDRQVMENDLITSTGYYEFRFDTPVLMLPGMRVVCFVLVKATASQTDIFNDTWTYSGGGASALGGNWSNAIDNGYILLNETSVNNVVYPEVDNLPLGAYVAFTQGAAMKTYIIDSIGTDHGSGTIGYTVQMILNSGVMVANADTEVHAYTYATGAEVKYSRITDGTLPFSNVSGTIDDALNDNLYASDFYYEVADWSTDWEFLSIMSPSSLNPNRSVSNAVTKSLSNRMDLMEESLNQSPTTKNMKFTGFLNNDITVNTTPAVLEMTDVQSEEQIVHTTGSYEFKKCGDLLCLFDLNLKVDGTSERVWFWMEQQVKGSTDWDVIEGSTKYIEYTALTEGKNAFSVPLSIEKGDKVRIKASTEHGSASLESTHRYFGDTLVKVPAVSLSIFQVM